MGDKLKKELYLILGIAPKLNNLAILKNKDLPILNLVIDENITELSLETKLESFIDILKQGENK